MFLTALDWPQCFWLLQFTSGGPTLVYLVIKPLPLVHSIPEYFLINPPGLNLTRFGQDSVAFGDSYVDQNGDDIGDFHVQVGGPKVLVLRRSYTCRKETGGSLEAC